MNKQPKIKEKLYQMFIMGMDGETLDKNPNLSDALKEGLGGVIFFTQNIKSVNQIKRLITDINCVAKTKPFLSIDQEGGRVERTENIHDGKKYLSAKFAAQNGEIFLRDQTEQISKELKEFGINLNFAPCLDVNTNPNNPIIGERAFSSDADEVIKFGKIVTETYLKNGIIPCSKHFPGHGDASIDSHISLPKIDLSLDEMEKFHIKPFREVEVPMIMVAHLHCTCFDREEEASSLSKNVIGYLRNDVGFDGLIITDDMIMGAIGKKGPDVKGNDELDMSVASVDSLLTFHAAKAIKAGVNILLYRNSYDETIQIVENLAKLAQTDQVLRENIEKSYERILTTKGNHLKFSNHRIG